MANYLKTCYLLFCMLLPSYIISINGQKLGATWKGQLMGTTLTTRNGRNIEAFLGIPYAKPPIGRLRFRNPEEVEYWDDIRDATTDGNQCPQLNEAGEVIGDEDCLYLNVYTPRILLSEEQTLFPTMVYIHGGDFARGNGSSTMFGPQYLLDKDVVLVTMNYRLGVLGFLSTGDSEAPGNFGLKDQVFALEWVAKNIVFFGGDRNQVTLFGHDAGSASAQLHSVSHLSDGLFKQYIAQSGITFSTKKKSKYVSYATKLGDYLKCPTANSQVLINCLRMVDIHSLVNSNDIFKNTFHIFNIWGPTEEPPLYGAFLTEAPIHLYFVNRVKDYPSIIGNVADEGLMFTAPYYSNDTRYKEIVNNLDVFLLNITRDVFERLTPEVYAARIKDFYFKGIEPSQKETFLKNLTNLMSDITFLISGAYLEETIITSQHYTAFLYSFDYRGTFSKTSTIIGSNANIGVTHGDELIYLFPTSAKQLGQRQLKLSESDKQISDTMVDLWTSFAYNGTPSTIRFSDPDFWQPFVKNREYLIIGNNSDTSLSHQDHFREARKTFWLDQITDQLVGGFNRALDKH